MTGTLTCQPTISEKIGQGHGKWHGKALIA